MALKFLRDETDSANAVANMHKFGQTSYNFFENSLHSNLADTFELTREVQNSEITRKVTQSTNFVSSLGHSDFALYTQDGAKVENPVFPFSLRYEPCSSLSYSDEDYNMTVFEHLN